MPAAACRNSPFTAKIYQTISNMYIAEQYWDTLGHAVIQRRRPSAQSKMPFADQTQILKYEVSFESKATTHI